MTSFKDLGYIDYDHYLLSNWFTSLTEKLIYSNPKAKCYICTRKRAELDQGEYLLLHHISYENLGQERLKRDVYIVCSYCHSVIHFYFFKQKQKLNRKLLLKRMKKLKATYYLQKKRFSLALWYFFRSMS